MTSRYTRVWHAITRRIIYICPKSKSPFRKDIIFSIRRRETEKPTDESPNHNQCPHRSLEQILSFLSFLSLCCRFFCRFWGQRSGNICPRHRLLNQFCFRLSLLKFLSRISRERMHLRLREWRCWYYRYFRFSSNLWFCFRL